MGSSNKHIGRVFDLPIHRSSSWIFNCYVLEGDHGPVVVDPGLPSTTRGAIEIISSLDEPGAVPISTLCTHGHVDHLAGMPLLRSKYGARAFLPARCEGYIEGETPRSFDTKTAMRFLPFVTQQPFAIRSLLELAKVSSSIGFGGGAAEFQFPFAPAGFLKDGDRVPGASRWQVFASPGHSDDSISFYDAESATLLSGDAVLTIDGRAWFNPESLDDAESRRSEERLRALDVRHLLPGHGLPIVGRVWDKALSHTAPVPGKSLLARCARRIL